MRVFFPLLVALLFTSCATRTPQTDALVKNEKFSPRSARIEGVPFIKQEVNHCGPASLKMVLDHQGVKVALEDLARETFTPGKEGTLPTDMMTAVRRNRMLPVEVAHLPSLLTEVSQGHPVVVFQNLGLETLPQWHYAVVTGFDLKGPDIILHTGPHKNKVMDLRLFERSWGLARHWGIVVVRPGELTATGTDLDHIKAASGLEQLGLLPEAEVSYQSVLKKWPESLSALIGMGNIRYQQKRFRDSVRFLMKATEFHPDSSLAWHNLAVAQGSAGKISASRVSAKRALEKVDPTNKTAYEISLKTYLRKNLRNPDDL